jgi:alkanesulfonate monooxygenase SsuD/methylene tetrahydromethanopterin reductase-like flavin-dependent oxidoreductase (luciferase family)
VTERIGLMTALLLLPLRQETAVVAKQAATLRDDPPQIIVGGASDQALRRAAEYGDGWMLGGGAPERFTELAEKLSAAWREQGRKGEPRKLALTYFALGDDPEQVDLLARAAL